jgi:dephospho-CoA kinase
VRDGERGKGARGYGSSVLRVGLTGTLGAGKSTVGNALATRGAAVIDADQVARDVIAPGSPGQRAVLERFGDRVMGPAGPAGQAGQLDRKMLADLVFADATARAALEAITHPLIRAEVLRRAALARNEVVVIEIPLLDKARRSGYALDVVVLVDAPESLAVQRAVGRGLTEPGARARMAAQPSDAERRSLADRVIVNDGSWEKLEIEVDELWAWLVRLSRRSG